MSDEKKNEMLRRLASLKGQDIECAGALNGNFKVIDVLAEGLVLQAEEFEKGSSYGSMKVVPFHIMNRCYIKVLEVVA